MIDDLGKRIRVAAYSSMQHALRKIGLEVRWFRNAHVEEQIVHKVLKLTRPAIVLDVGANSGQFGDLVTAAGFKGTIISFEALPEPHRRLKAHALASGADWRVATCAALGSEVGETDMYVSGNLASSSILPMLRRHLDAAPESAYMGTVRVPVTRLDDLVGQDIPRVGEIYMKIDTQGYELKVLGGAGGLLKRVNALQVELSTVPLYDGAPSFLEMLAYLESRHFRIFGIAPELTDPQTGQLLQANGFFVRESAQ